MQSCLSDNIKHIICQYQKRHLWVDSSYKLWRVTFEELYDVGKLFLVIERQQLHIENMIFDFLIFRQPSPVVRHFQCEIDFNLIEFFRFTTKIII